MKFESCVSYCNAINWLTSISESPQILFVEKSLMSAFQFSNYYTFNFGSFYFIFLNLGRRCFCDWEGKATDEYKLEAGWTKHCCGFGRFGWITCCHQLCESSSKVFLNQLHVLFSCSYFVSGYMDKVHRPGNRLVFVHVIELPEPKLNEARKSRNILSIYTRLIGCNYWLSATVLLQLPGSLHMSPGVLASMWQDEEKRVKDLEQKMKTLLKEKQVEQYFTIDNSLTAHCFPIVTYIAILCFR